VSVLNFQGFSDVMYSFQHLYQGNRVLFKDFKEQKLRRARTGAMFTINSLLSAVVLEFAKSGVKKITLMFIEGNIKKVYQNSTLGLKGILDNVFQNKEVKKELDLFNVSYSSFI